MAATIGRREVASYLIEKGWDPSATTHTVSSRYHAHGRAILEKKDAADGDDDGGGGGYFSHSLLPIARQGHTPLHLAATRARYEIVKIILSSEVGRSTISTVDDEGKTPIISSCVELHDDELGRNETSE